jgi:hypothetical protein
MAVVALVTPGMLASVRFGASCDTRGNIPCTGNVFRSGKGGKRWVARTPSSVRRQNFFVPWIMAFVDAQGIFTPESPKAPPERKPPF